jgi:hypothetical protein
MPAATDAADRGHQELDHWGGRIRRLRARNPVSPLPIVGEANSHDPMLDFVWHLRGSIALNRSTPDKVVLEKVARLWTGKGSR